MENKMAQNSNTTLEMGNSDQVLVATKKKKTKLIIGFIAMLIVIGVVITLVVVLPTSDSAVAEPIVSTTEGPTTPIDASPTTTTTTTTTTAAPTDPDPPGDSPLDLEEIIDGAFAPPSFNATWATGSEVLFRNENGDLILYDVDTDSSNPIVSNTSVILQRASRIMELSPDRSQVVLSYDVAPIYRYSFLARYSAIDVVSGDVVDIVPPGVEPEAALLQNFVWGPSGTSLAFVYLNNIYYQSGLTAAPQQVTTNGLVNVIYHGIPDWVYEEEIFGSNNALYFSRDGTKLAYVSFDDTSVRVMRVPHYGVPGSVNYQYTQHHEIRYPKSGTNNPSVSVSLRDIATATTNTYNAPAGLTDPIIKTVKFATNESVAIMWSDRVQTSLIVQLCTSGQTACTEIFSYTQENGWIDNIPLIFNDEGTAFITILPQLVDGLLFKQVVQVSQGAGNAPWTSQNRVNTPHTVLEILHWGLDDVIWYKATRVEDSAEQHIYTASEGSAISCFTCEIRRQDGGACLYNEATMSYNGGRITINCAGPDVPQVFVYNADGTLVRVWDDGAELTAMITGRSLPTTIRLSVSTAIGLPAADVHIQVPADYLNRTNIPLLVYVYGGPDTALVTKQWSLDWGSSLVSRKGIAVAHIDGRGSGLRGANNMFTLNRRLGTVEIQDQITVTKYLQDNLPWMSKNNTCIWGWSYGGYAASKALAEGGDVFRCAMAVAPVVDWRFYDTIYTERYMDTPQANAEAYAASSLLTDEFTENLRNKSYFLIHGTADDNVHYQHAMLLSRRLQRNDVYFTQMSYTDEDHGLVGVRPHLYHGLERFLDEHML